jgi:hypothetical protein
VGKEDERLERWRARGMIWSAAVGGEEGGGTGGGFFYFLREEGLRLRKRNGFRVFYF